MRARLLLWMGLFTLVVGLGTGGCSSSAEITTNPPPATSQPLVAEEVLRDDMRELWTQHVVWTRVFLMVAIEGLPDEPQATERLLQNQVDIGNAIKPFYGVAAGDELTALLTEHITGAVAVVDAAMAGDDAAFEAANAAWYDNAHEIAAFLASANPNWDLAHMTAMMDAHLDYTLDEATARLTGDWAADVEIYDTVKTQILDMADMLTDGIVAQFPDLVSPPTMTPEEQGLHLAMRELWEDHVIWTRVFLIGAIAGLPDVPFSTDRLLQNQVDIGTAIKPFYGGPAGDELTALLTEHILGAADVLAAAMAGDEIAFEVANEAWYDNGYQIAQFLAAANPHWSLEELVDMMNEHLDLTLDEATARLNADWEADVSIYDAVEEEILMMADELSMGISMQFGHRPPVVGGGSVDY